MFEDEVLKEITAIDKVEDLTDSSSAMIAHHSLFKSSKLEK